MSVREYNRSKKPLLGESDNALVMLVAINAIVFVLLNFLKIVYFLSYDSNATAETFFNRQILDWFILPASFDKLVTRPWTILTCMISNYSIWGLISTLLWLWGFGYILQDLAGNKIMFPLYIYGGVAGSVFFLLGMNFIPALHQNIDLAPAFMGSGAAVMAIAVAATTIAPDYRIFPLINGGIPLWVLTLIFVAIDYATIASASGGYALAHLAGGFIGFVYIRQLRKGIDIGAWMHQLVTWFDNLFNPEKKQAGTSRDRLFYKSIGKPYQKTPNVTQQRLDDILDKINQQGYHMLTDEEKEFLKRASKEEL
ncbi:MAG: rhomboid family intramembrane serine protease [Bacteroidota bacterium]|nr:rhomboid family intramembrane serine protease [Bacteroidota bacterium]